MPFQKNNKLGGRKPGSVNKITQNMREFYLNILESNMENFQDDLENLEPKERIKVIMELAGYFLPKLKSIDISTLPQQQENKEISTQEIKIILDEIENEY